MSFHNAPPLCILANLEGPCNPWRASEAFVRLRPNVPRISCSSATRNLKIHFSSHYVPISSEWCLGMNFYKWKSNTLTIRTLLTRQVLILYFPTQNYFHSYDRRANCAKQDVYIEQGRLKIPPGRAKNTPCKRVKELGAGQPRWNLSHVRQITY